MSLRPTSIPLPLSALAALLLILLAPTAVLAHTQIHPTVFALSPASFPPGSTLVRAGVESNHHLLRDDQLHFALPPAVVGRLSGYYMDAVEGDPTAQPRIYTSYLVSIFPTVRQADLAFRIRYDNWFDIDYFTDPPPPPISVGDRDEVALFHTLDATQPRVSELFFVRRTILVEVFQGTGYRDPTAAEIQSFYAIAIKLDALAGKHPGGA